MKNVMNTQNFQENYVYIWCTLVTDSESEDYETDYESDSDDN